MRVDQVVVIATSHLSRHTANTLDEQGDKNPWVPCASYSGGWLLWFGPTWDDDWPADLRAMHRWVMKLPYAEHGSVWVRLDCDADTIPELQTFDW